MVWKWAQAQGENVYNYKIEELLKKYKVIAPEEFIDELNEYIADQVGYARMGENL